MDNYIKGRVIEVDDQSGHPFGHLCPSDVTHMKVKVNTKTKNIVDYSVKHFVVQPSNRQIVISGWANASTKAISCAELLKQRHRNKVKEDLFQKTEIGYKTVEEFWEPKDTKLDTLKVVRKVPVIHLLLSKDPLDLTADGVQYKDNNICSQLSDKRDVNSNKPKQNRNRNQRSKNWPKSNRRSDERTDRTESQTEDRQP